MAGPGELVHLVAGVVVRALVLVEHLHGDGRAERDAELGAGHDAHAVLLVAWRRDGALTRPPPRQLRLDVVLRQAQARRAAVDDDRHSRAVRFAGAAESQSSSCVNSDARLTS